MTAGILALLLGLGRPVAPPPDPLEVYRSLPGQERAWVDRERRTVSRPVEDLPSGGREGERTLRVQTVGIVGAPPAVVAAVLGEVRRYPGWILLHPGYKEIEVTSPDSFHLGVGRSDSPRVRRRLRIATGSSGGGERGVVRWTVSGGPAGIGEGSTLEFCWAPHPATPGATLLVQRETVYSPQGRALEYLRRPKGEGRTQFWVDARRRAQRMHWAVASAAEVPGGGPDRLAAAYLTHYRREFDGKSPPGGVAAGPPR